MGDHIEPNGKHSVKRSHRISGGECPFRTAEEDNGQNTNETRPSCYSAPSTYPKILH